MIPILGIPILNRGDLLLRLVKSIDFPVEKLVIVNNSRGNDFSVDEALTEINALINAATTPVAKLQIINPEHNLGVSGSWNKIMSETSEAAYWLIVGNDMMFNPGELEKIHTFADANKHDHAVMYALGHNAFVVTPYCLATVGNFDENFYPAYLEDCDHSYRIKLSGVKSSNIPDVAPVHGEAPSFGSSTIFSNPRWRELNGITHGNNFKYYRSKWGGNNGEETYLYPFDDPSISLKTWELDPGHRARNDIWT